MSQVAPPAKKKAGPPPLRLPKKPGPKIPMQIQQRQVETPNLDQKQQVSSTQLPDSKQEQQEQSQAPQVAIDESMSANQKEPNPTEKMPEQQNTITINQEPKDPSSDINHDSLDNFNGELLSNTANVQKVEAVQTPIRAPPVPKKVLKPVPRKPANVPKPPPAVIRHNPVSQPEQETTAKQPSTEPNADLDQVSKQEEPPPNQQIILNCPQTSVPTKVPQDQFETPLKKQQVQNQKVVQTKKPNRVVPPPSLTSKVTSRLPPRQKVQDMNGKQRQEALGPKKQQQSPQAVTSKIAPSISENKQKQQSQVFKPMDDGDGQTPQSANIQSFQKHIEKSQSSLVDSKYNLTPKYANLKNKLKDFSIRKQKMLESSESDSEIHSQTYSEMHENKNRTWAPHNAQSLIDKPNNLRQADTPINASPNIIYEKAVVTNSFHEEMEASIQGMRTGMGKKGGELNQLQRMASQQVFPQHQKEQLQQPTNQQNHDMEEQEIKRVNRVKSSIVGFQESIKADTHEHKDLSKQKLENYNLPPRSDETQGKTIEAQIDNFQVQNQIEQSNSKLTGGLLKRTDKQSGESNLGNRASEIQQPAKKAAPIPPPIKKISGRGPPAPAPKQKPIPRPQFESEIPPHSNNHEHRQEIDNPIQSLNEIVKQDCEKMRKQGELGQIEQLLQQFNRKKQGYLKNAQELTDICMTNREKEYAKLSVINQLIRRLEQENLKMKSTLLNY